MSARMETEPVPWESTESIDQDSAERVLGEIQIEALVVNAERSNSTQAEEQRAGPPPEWKGGLLLGEQWNSWAAKRDEMQMEIKRGKECLEQVQRELATLRGRLEEWPAYESVCGKNPMGDYLQAISVKERIEQYLPIWLKRREEQLRALDLQLKNRADSYGPSICSERPRVPEKEL